MDCDPNQKEFFFSTAFSNNISHKPKMGNEFYSLKKSACPSNNSLPFQDMQPHFGSQFTIEGGSSSNPSFEILNRSIDPFKPSSFKIFKEFNPYPSGGVGSVPIRANDEGLLHAYQNDRPPIRIGENQIIGDDDHHHQYQTSNFNGFKGISMNKNDNVPSYTTTEIGRSLKAKQTVSGGINERRLEMRRASRARSSAHAAKGKWTSEEDEMLIQLVKTHGEGNWKIVAERIQTRVGKQCRERWYNHLHPNIKTSPWTEEEDMILIQLHSKFGNGWSKMAKWLQGRTENSIKNHWNVTKRRQLSKHKTKMLSQSSIQLQEYIQSVILREKKNITSASSSGGAGAGGVGNETAEFYPTYNNASNDYDDEDEDDEADAMDGDGGVVPGHGQGHGHGGIVPGDDDGHGHGGVAPCDGHGGGVSGPGDGGADIFADCYIVAPPVVDHHYRDMPYYGVGCGYGGGSSVGEVFYEIPYHYTDFDMMMGVGGGSGLMNKETDILEMFPQKKS